MGTRSLTYVYDTHSSERICAMYRQMDGYPTGHGQDLYAWAQDIRIVNGLGASQSTRVANGMRCFSAQMVAHFKDDAGGIYLYPPSVTDAGQDYEYHISCTDDGQLCLKVVSYTTVLYDGFLRDFDAKAVEAAQS